MWAEMRHDRRRLQAAKTAARKIETRQKIKQGGLITKVGLAQEPTAVLLGLLLDAAEQLSDEQESVVRAQWRLKGDIVLTQEEMEKEERKRSR